MDESDGSEEKVTKIGVLKSTAVDSADETADDATTFLSKTGVKHEIHSSGIVPVCLTTGKWPVETVTEEGVDVTRYGRIGKGND